MLPIYRKEMRMYFTQMIGYIFLTFLILLTGLFFSFVNVFSSNPNYYQVLSNTTIFFLILVPTLTMRLFAEEARHKTDQLLFTSPLTVRQIVIGKFLAALTLFLIGMGVTVLFPLILSFYGTIPVAQIAGAYLGYILLGVSYIAVGLFISVLTDNQIIAAVATFAALFVLNIMDALAQIMPSTTTASLIFVALLVLAAAAVLYSSTKNALAAGIVGILGAGGVAGLYLFNNLIFDGIIVKSLKWLSVYTRFINLMNGILNVSDIVYYVSFITLFIYMTVNVIEKRRWRS